MDEQLQRAAEDGDIDKLYARLASETLFAMEIATLRPSLARKLNHLGLSPMHLALQNGQVQTVRALMTVDVDLIRVKGRGRVTPLHYAAEIEADVLLAEFLSACPSSIEDLTSRCETAVHVAVKNGKLNSVKVLVGWLMRVKMEEILNWNDEDGNTVLHIATLTNQPEVIKLLIGRMNVNAKNFEGLTALDIFYERFQHNNKEEVGKILRNANAKRASSLSGVTGLSDHLSRQLTFSELQDRFLNVLGNGSNTKSPRDMILVVAGLVAAATYQAVLSPPGGYWQDDHSPNTTTATATATSTATAGREGKPHSAGKMIMSGPCLYLFLGYNTAAFLTSACTILDLLL
ncbi:ankyrin repeat-containing protein BDA1 isoform X2 [Eucalyptus grandis]|uniref:ankyrin repeat-containing protein BDA1 isoform X2 n=1 Tax=Eucalyptus grandis TaxID=71139 RepID=UPI00192ED40E|nr:ankyrin repeat-containing protein BDA1 isoform X2 [Eucalyptus grandis]